MKKTNVFQQLVFSMLLVVSSLLLMGAQFSPAPMPVVSHLNGSMDMTDLLLQEPVLVQETKELKTPLWAQRLDQMYQTGRAIAISS